MKSIIPWKWNDRHAVPEHGTRSSVEPFGSWLTSGMDLFASNLPAVDVNEDAKRIVVKAELPGMNGKDIALTWRDGCLTISGEKRNEREERKEEHWYRECSYGSFHRTIHTGGVDWEKASARYDKGVLTVTLPKASTEQNTIKVTIQ